MTIQFLGTDDALIAFVLQCQAGTQTARAIPGLAIETREFEQGPIPRCGGALQGMPRGPAAGPQGTALEQGAGEVQAQHQFLVIQLLETIVLTIQIVLVVRTQRRSEERRVGKECRSRWSA